MKPLSKRYLKIGKKSESATTWLVDRQCEINIQVASAATVPDGSSGFSLFLASLGICLLVCLCVMLEPPHPWGTALWLLSVIGGPGIIGLLYAIIQGRRAAHKNRLTQEDRRIALENERDSEPLYQRAKLIEKAMFEYKLHCIRYMAWYEAVDEGLREPDEELADRYHTFIVKAHRAIEQALENFFGAVEMCRQQEEFQKSHQELVVEPTSAALTELLARLDQPVGVPRLRILDDPAKSLEEEEAAAELEAFLSDKELAARIDSAASKS